MSNFIATYITIGYTSSAILADYTTLHMTNTVFQFIWWILFMLCLFKSPGFVPDETVGINRPPASTKPPYEKNTIQGMYFFTFHALHCVEIFPLYCVGEWNTVRMQWS